MSHWKPGTITFTCFGVEFEAEVKTYPGYPGSREQPPEGPELEFVSLKYNGNDVSFMLGNEHLLEELDEAAWKVLNEDYIAPEEYGPEDVD